LSTPFGPAVMRTLPVYSMSSLLGSSAWNQAAGADVAEPLVQAVVEDLRSRGLEVATGQFGAHMVIDMQADGPVTIELEA